jgi:hypothetical protein
MTSSYDSMNESAKHVMICLRCHAELVPDPELEGGDWILPCLECGAKNLIESAWEIVAWRR